MDTWKSRGGKSQRNRKSQKNQKKEDAGAQKGRKVAKHCVFPMICGSGGSKSRLAKAAGAEPCGQMGDEKPENKQMWWILILPLHATSCHFKWRMPYATSSGVCHFKWREVA